MIAAVVRFAITNLPRIFFVLALVITYARSTPQPASYRYLSENSSFAPIVLT